MKLLFSIPTGYHLRELLRPLKALLEQDAAIEKVICVSPGASFSDQLFPDFSEKFFFVEHPTTVEGMKDMLNTYKPNLVITNTIGHDALDYPVLQAAKDLSIRTATFIASWDNIWKIARLLRDNKPTVEPDDVVVWNEMMRDHFLRLFPGTDSTRVHVIGAARLDYFFHKEELPKKEELYAYLGLSDTSRPLIHFSTTELYPMDYIVKTIAEAIQRRQITHNPYLYVSVHPGGNIEKHKKMEELGAIVRYSFGRQEKALHPNFAYNPSEDEIRMHAALFLHSSLLINQSSTTAIESLCADIPVINVTYGERFDWWRWYRSMVYRDFKQHYADVITSGATRVVQNPAQLIQATREYLDHPEHNREERRQTLKKMITTIDGTASRKILDLFMRLAT